MTDREPSPVNRVAVNAFSTPIYDRNGSMIMAISLASAASLLGPDRDGPVPGSLVAAAEDLPARIAHEALNPRADYSQATKDGVSRWVDRTRRSRCPKGR